MSLFLLKNMISVLKQKQQHIRKQYRRCQLQQVLQQARSPLSLSFQTLMSGKFEENQFLEQLKRFTELAGTSHDDLYQKLIAAGAIQKILQTEFNQVTSLHLPTILTNTLAQKDHLIYALVSRPAFWRLLAVCSRQDFMAVENLSLFENWHVKQKALNLLIELKQVPVKQISSLIRTLFNLTHVQPVLEYSKSVAIINIVQSLVQPFKSSLHTDDFLLLLRVLQRLSGPHSNRVSRFLQYPGLVSLVFQWKQELAFTKILEYQMKILSNLVENKNFNAFLSQSQPHLNQVCRLLVLDSRELLQTQLALSDQLICFGGHQRHLIVKFRQQILYKLIQRVSRGSENTRKKFLTAVCHLLQHSKLQDILRLSENKTFIGVMTEGLKQGMSVIEALSCLETMLLRLSEEAMQRELVQQLRNMNVVRELQSACLIESMAGELSQRCLRVINQL